MAISLQVLAQRIRECGLMSRDDLQSFVQSLPRDRRPTDGEQFANLLVAQKRLTSYQAQQLLHGQHQTLVLGNYVVLEKLGQGGMGMVLKAEHRRMARTVAIKVLSPNITKDEEAVRRFQREVKAAARLEHPNIVIAHDADEANGTHYLVMQNIEGKDLDTLVRENGPLPVDEALSYVLQAAAGFEYAHAQGVVHRDIKPSNLMVDVQGDVKILDMGLARLDGGSIQDQLTGTGQLMGTVDFMAPEQATDPRSVDSRADIYSLGITLWYLLTGQPAYEGDTLFNKLVAHQSQPIPSFADSGVAASPELQTVFAKMAAKSPADRHQSMTEVIADLESCRATVPAGTVPSVRPRGTTTQRTGPISRRQSAPPPLRETEELHVSLGETSYSPRTKRRPAQPPSKPLRKKPFPMAWAVGGLLGLAACVAAVVLLATRTPDDTVPAQTKTVDPKDNTKTVGKELVTKEPDDNSVVSRNPRPEPPKPPVGNNDVLARVDVARDAIEGVWRRDGQALLSPVQSFAQLKLPGPFPEQYDLHIEVTRETGVGPLVIGLPVGSTRCTATIDLASPSHGARLEELPTLRQSGSKLMSNSAALPVGELSRVRCVVRTRSVEVFLNDQLLLRHEGDVSSFTTPAYWHTKNSNAAFISACVSRFRISSIAIENPDE